MAMANSGPLVLQEIYDFMHVHGYWSKRVSADWTPMGYVNVTAPRMVRAMTQDASVREAVKRIAKSFRYGLLVNERVGSLTLFPMGNIAARKNPKRGKRAVWRPELDKPVRGGSRGDAFSWMRSWWAK